MPLKTALPPTGQEQFELAVQDCIAGVSQSDLEVLREIPGTHRGESLDLASELAGISIFSVKGERYLGVHLYFVDKPEGDRPLIPDETIEPAYEFPTDIHERDPTFLGDLGGGYADLSEAVVETFSAYCDAYEFEPGEYFVGDVDDLLCTPCYDRLITSRRTSVLPSTSMKSTPRGRLMLLGGSDCRIE